MAVPGRHDARDGHMFTRIGNGSQPTRSTRSWTENGVHYTTTSYSSPGISFGAMTGSTSGPFRSFTTPARPTARNGASGGLFGTAFGLLEDILSTPQPRHHVYSENMGGLNIPGRRRAQVGQESDTDDDDLVYEDYDHGRSRPKSVFTRLKDRLLDNKSGPRHSRDSSYSPEQSQSREFLRSESRVG